MVQMIPVAFRSWLFSLSVLLAASSFELPKGNSSHPRMGQTVKFGRVPFKIGFSHSLSRPQEGWQAKLNEQRSLVPEFPKCQKLEGPDDSQQTALLLSRSQSLSSSDIFQLLSVNDKDDQGNHEHNVNEEIKQSMDGIQTLLSGGMSPHTRYQKIKARHRTYMTVGAMAESLKIKLANMVQRGCGRKREDMRHQTAQMHAALSVARLATAVAGMVGNCHPEPTNSDHKKMHAAIASAAALVAASCAEAAKLTGASREQISSVIHMGMETRALGDLSTLTTSAATCLKGANALKMRNRAVSDCALEDHMNNQRGVRLPVRTPDGKLHNRMVSVHCKYDKIMLKLDRGHSFTTSKEYIVFDEHGGTTDFSYATDEHSYHAINLKTSGGNIQLLFEEHEQYSTWKSFIRYMIINKTWRLSY
ncbi:hypothetical protein GUJ93_ZPchr0002g25777 [Zizania palustris]|uniref:VAN3-binding protein-like auxin canalisation domain-containing protein n=1 Tax=Zizania palustris TaxID=103762 RepID=A0A8J5VTT7_ZIZPA|nr:hypothetical protein GUJ93_ZPchr0002g25777 [Zizania palustris]